MNKLSQYFIYNTLFNEEQRNRENITSLYYWFRELNIYVKILYT